MTNRVAVEKVGRLLADGLEDLTLQHWEEVEEPESHVPLKVDWDRVLELERLGCFVAFGARRAGRLVGYSGFLVGPSLHGRESVAVNDVVFLAKPCRGWLGVRLIREPEQHFAACGIARITYHTKLAPILGNGRKAASVGDLLLRLGYDPIEAVHAKRLGAEHGQRRRQRTHDLQSELATGR
jgi:hypothetical protein